MKKNLYSTLAFFLISSCIRQPAAPIEYGQPKSGSSSNHYSERTTSKLSNNEGIKRRELTRIHSDSVGELKEKVKPFTEIKEENIDSEKSEVEKDKDDNAAPVKEKKVEIEISKKETKHKDLEEEMDEIESQQVDDKSEKLELNDEKVIPEKVVHDDEQSEEPELKFAMPVSGKIITRFGENRNGKKSNGIDISASSGASVKSIAAGKVVYAGQDPKFGNLVIVKVGSTEMFAAYAHMDDLLLSKDDDVTIGQVIGHVGSTGDAEKPELHFALRKGKTPVDPMGYLTH